MFYTFRQNNSGGVFRAPAINVIIEASSALEANAIALTHDIYFDGCDDGTDCSCCGDRWYRVSDSDASEKPELYGKEVTDNSEPEPEDLPSLHAGHQWVKTFRKQLNPNAR